MDWILSLLLATVRLAIPVLLISLAELYGQRAGMVNIGLEGLASIGARVGFLVCYVTGSNWLGLLCGALAAVIFGRWNAGGILLACLFFGFCDALQIRLQVSGIAIPYQFFQMIPYVATVVVLSLIGTRQAGPKANGKPYRREQR